MYTAAHHRIGPQMLAAFEPRRLRPFFTVPGATMCPPLREHHCQATMNLPANQRLWGMDIRHPSYTMGRSRRVASVALGQQRAGEFLQEEEAAGLGGHVG